MSLEHIIDKVTIQFTAPESAGKEVAKTLNETKEEIRSIIEAICDEYAPDKSLIVISQLQLDLDTVSIQEFPEAFNGRLRSLLSVELKKFLEKEEVKTYLQEKSAAENIDYFLSLKHYLKFGFSESLQRESPFNPDQLIQSLYQLDHKRLTSMIESVWPSPKARRRLRQISPQLLSKIKGALPINQLEFAEEKNLINTVGLLTFYYRFGEFPPYALVLKTSDLEILVNSVLHGPDNNWINHFKKQIKVEEFTIRIAETLSLDTIKKIAEYVTDFKETLEGWRSWETVLKAIEPPYSIQTVSGKIAFLHFLTSSSEKERARIMHEHLHLESLWHTIDFSPGKLSKALDTIKSEIEATTYRLVLQQIQSIEQLYFKKQTGKQARSIELHTILLPETSVHQLSEVLRKLYSTEPNELAQYIRDHWETKGLRYNLALRIDNDLRELITKMVWGTHESYEEWVRFEAIFNRKEWNGNQSQKVRAHLYFHYFQFLSLHGKKSWNKEQFTEWMLLQIHQLIEKDDGGPAGLGSNLFSLLSVPIHPSPNRLEILTYMLHRGIKSTLSQVPGLNNEDMQIFWDSVLTSRTEVFQIFKENTTKENFWIELTDTMSVIQLQQLLTILAPFQYDHIAKLEQEIQQYTIRHDVENSILSYKQSYHVLFSSLSESGYNLGKIQLVGVLIQSVLDQHHELNDLFKSSQWEDLPKGFQETYPLLYHSLLNIRPDWRIYANLPDSDKNETTQDHLHFGILDKEDGKYDLQDLIQYYLKTGMLPDWSELKTEAELGKELEKLIDLSSTEAVKVLSFAWQEPETKERLEQLIAKSKHEQLIKSLKEDSVPPYSQDKQVEVQRVGALLYFWTFSDWPWWYSTESQDGNKTNAYLEEATLKRSVLQHHLDMFLTQVQLTNNESEIALKMIRGVSQSDFLRTVTLRFPSASGFIVSLFVMINELKSFSETIIQAAYGWAYRYLLKSKKEFSSRVFTRSLVHFLAQHSGSDKKELAKSLKDQAEEMMVNDKRFWIVFEILEQIINSHEVNQTDETQISKTEDQEPWVDATTETPVPHSNLESMEARTDALLYFWTYSELPWWYLHKSQDNSGLPDIPTLRSWVIKHHLAHFVEKMKASEYESSIATGLIQGIPLSDFIHIIKLRFSPTHSYVNATLELTDQLSAKMSIPLITQGVYVWVYSHLLENQAEFTIKSFTQRFIQFIAQYTGSNTIELTKEIRRHAKKIMAKKKEFGVVFEILEEMVNSDEIHESNELQSVESKDHKFRTDDTAALLVPHSNLESTEASIDILLHYWAYLELPLWLTTSQEHSEVADVPALKNLVVKHHLAHFVKKMKASGYESRIITGLIKDIPLSDFFRIISVRFYHVSGYVNSVLKLTRLLSSKISVPLITNGLYIWVYSYLLKSEREFTAQSFTLRFIQFISVNNRLNNKELTKKLLDLASKTEEGVSQFEVILEILRSLVDVKELHKIKENAITASQEVGQKAQLDNFIDALGSYIRFGTMPLGMYNTIFSKEEFLQAFDNLTERDPRQVEEHIRGLLSNRMLLEDFVKRAEDQVLRRIVKIFSAGRFGEFESWMKEMKEFISLSMEYEDATLARFIPSMTLLSLLLGRNGTLISLIQFIEHALSSLSSQVTNQFMLGEKIVAYKTRSEASTYFVKTLETVEASIKEKGRQTILQKLLTEKPDTKKEVPVSISGKLRVQNAGIVLVAPFLYRYFEKLEMTQEGMFKTDELSWRAVQLVQFLASGSTEAYEHDLLLNKILCGVDIDTPIERKIELTSLELDVSESLLSGVLQNWDKIKTESLDALREGFLMREGYLEDAEMSWELEVDRKAMDVLVDLIPWSFSTIKLSWMKKSLTTIWQSDEYRKLM